MEIENPEFEFKIQYGKNENGTYVFMAERVGELEDLKILIESITAGHLHGIIPEHQTEVIEAFQTITSAFLQSVVEYPTTEFQNQLNKDFLSLTRSFNNLFRHD